MGEAGGRRLAAGTDDLIGRIGAWDARSWAVPVGDRTRADVVFALVTELADLAADTEGRPRRPVPRLADTALVDQLVVMVRDVALTGSASAGRAALDALDRARQQMLPRR